MPPKPPSKTDPIIIVGAGIFGLSTALHLARRGYRNVTVFDRQPYEKTLYSYLDGCDAASADINKIIRSAYGAQTEYQSLSTEALSEWEAWNDEIKAGNVPPGMKPSDSVFVQCGHLTCSDATELPAFERATVEGMEAAGHRGTQLISNEPSHLKLASEKGMRSAMEPLSRPTLGVLDTTGGLAVADKACRFALHKAKMLGVRFILDPAKGKFDLFLHDDVASPSRVTGICTADGKEHRAEMVIMACGGWTPTLLPALDGICETTAGSVVILKIPEASPLRDRFHPSRFPSYAFKMHDGAEGGLYGFPVNENGHLKIGYRGTKYTNPRTQADGIQRSVPVTRWTGGQDGTLTQIPEQAYTVIRKFLDEYLPELGREGIDIWTSRVCWYTDSFDNHFVVDHVPENEGLMCATGGSGHAFKYLPNIGSWVVDIMEGVGLERPAVRCWKWRNLEGGVEPVNKLMEGEKGGRALGNVSLVRAEAPREKL